MDGINIAFPGNNPAPVAPAPVEPPQQQAPEIGLPVTDEQFKSHNFMSKCREWLNNRVPKFRRPRLDNWS